MNRRMAAIFLTLAALTVVLWAFLAIAIAPSPARAQAQEDYASWPVLRSTFPSTGGGGFVIKGYDPVITGGKCITTFMAIPPGDNPQVYRQRRRVRGGAGAGRHPLPRRQVARVRRRLQGHDAVPLLLQGRRVPRARREGVISRAPDAIAARLTPAM